MSEPIPESALLRHILTSTDSAVLDAMQDALVRAGRLRLDESAAYSDDHGETWYVMFGRAPSRVPMCRLVTDWRTIGTDCPGISVRSADGASATSASGGNCPEAPTGGGPR